MLVRLDGSRPVKYLVTGEEDPKYATVADAISAMSAVPADRLVFLEVRTVHFIHAMIMISYFIGPVWDSATRP